MRPHVLVARLDNAGDVLLAGPAVRAVAAGARWVTLLCGPQGEAAARLLPGVDEVRVLRAPWTDPEREAVDPRLLRSFVAEMQALCPDQALILTSSRQTAQPLALLLRMAGISPVAATSDDYSGSQLEVRHRLEGEMHEVERLLSLVAGLGYALPPGDDGSLRVRRNVGRRPAAARGSYVVVHPVVSGATGPVHLAAAVGTPVVDLDAPTLPEAAPVGLEMVEDAS